MLGDDCVLGYAFYVLFNFLKIMEFSPLPDLLNTRFTIIEISFFYGGKHLEQKYADL